MGVAMPATLSHTLLTPSLPLLLLSARQGVLLDTTSAKRGATYWHSWSLWLPDSHSSTMVRTKECAVALQLDNAIDSSSNMVIPVLPSVLQQDINSEM